MTQAQRLEAARAWHDRHVTERAELESRVAEMQTDVADWQGQLADRDSRLLRVREAVGALTGIPTLGKLTALVNTIRNIVGT